MAIDSKNIDDFIKVMTAAYGFQSQSALDLGLQQMLAKAQAQERLRQSRKQCKNLATINKMLKRLACHTSTKSTPQISGSSRISSKNSKTTSTPGSGTT